MGHTCKCGGQYKAASNRRKGAEVSNVFVCDRCSREVERRVRRSPLWYRGLTTDELVGVVQVRRAR